MKRILIPIGIVSIIILIFFLVFPDLEHYFSELTAYYAPNSKPVYAVLSFLILSADFILPVPSSILMFSNGWVLGFIPGFFLSIIANMMSSSFGYFLGKSATKKVDRLYNTEELKKAHAFINNYGEVGLILSRGIPILSEATSIVSGNMSFNFKRFIMANLLGYIPVCALYTYLGSISVNRNVFLMAVLINFVLAGIFWFLKVFLFKNKIVSEE